MRKFSIFLACFLVLCGFMARDSYSQSSKPAEAANPFASAVKNKTTTVVDPDKVKPEAEAEKPGEFLSTEAEEEPETAPTIVPFNEDKYFDPTYSNLAHLYWALGLLDVSNDTLVDHFVAITECEVFQTYINNDLEWKEIRESTRDYLRKNYRIFPTNFKITIPLYLLRYNVDGEYFEVDQEESAIMNARKIETIYTTKIGACGIGGDIPGYPQNLVLYLNRPFSLPQVPVERELARLFLDETNTRNAARNMVAMRATRRENSVRTAYLELMFHVHSYKETINTSSGTLKAVVYAQVDFIRVYADIDKEKVLFERDMYEMDGRNRKKRLQNISEEDLKLPSGPIFGGDTKKVDEEEE